MAVVVEKVKALTPADPEAALKDAEERLRIIESGYKRLKVLLTHAEDVIKERLASREKLRRVQEPALKSLYQRAVSPYNLNSIRARLGLANFVTAITWIDVDKVAEWLDPNVVATGVKIIRKVKQGVPISNLIMWNGVPKIIKPVSRMTRSLATAISLEKDKILKVIDWDSAAVFSPLSRLILTHTMYNLTRGTREGARVGVLGALGSGKTTYSFLSLFAVLRFLGFSEDEALELAKASVINDPLILVKVLKEITEHDIFIPCIIADDIAAIVSKHWIFESPASRKAASYLLRSIKISRENFGVIVFPSDTTESMPKALRESLDIEYQGEMIQANDYRSTLWLRLANETKSTNKGKMRREKVLESICATACPPLLTPPGVYSKLTKQKQAVRVMWLTKAEESLIRDLKGEEEEGNGKRKRRKSSSVAEAWGLPELLSG